MGRGEVPFALPRFYIVEAGYAEEMATASHIY
jgi:hypothetical protein